jgi:hypothetical protein
MIDLEEARVSPYEDCEVVVELVISQVGVISIHSEEPLTLWGLKENKVSYVAFGKIHVSCTSSLLTSFFARM